MKTVSTVKPTIAQLGNNTNPNQLSSVDLGLASFIVTLPVLVVVAVSAYRNYRCRLLRLQISTLERMWHLAPQENR
jgi:hypothetical protein